MEQGHHSQVLGIPCTKGLGRISLLGNSVAYGNSLGPNEVLGWCQASCVLSQPETSPEWTDGGVGCMELVGGELCSGPRNIQKTLK